MAVTKDAIRALAREVGFDLVGFTDAEPFLRDEEAALQRIGEGFMDGLPWYTEERVHRATHPESLLEGARSVISLGASYLTGDSPEADGTPRGSVARYAWGHDYHKVIKDRLRQLVNGLEAMCDGPVATRVFVDDGPMNDRAAAERSGLGWFGKNTNILTRSHGSWVFLAQVVTSLELAPDVPLSKTCGACTMCIDACPTGAIVRPYVIDNTRCISYLTIEHRGPIPREMRPLMGDWVFGCDICQDVCPVNRKALGSLEPAFQKRHDFDAPALLPLLKLDDEGFAERFRGSPIRRARRAGFQRNVCIALGNIGDRRAVPALARVLATGDGLVRIHAAWALGRIGGTEAVQALEAAKAGEADADVVAEITLALADALEPARSR